MNPFGEIGVWRSRAVPLDAHFASEVERLGYSTLWIGGSPDGDLDPALELLDATEKLVVATSITNIWKTDARVAAHAYHRLEAAHPGRFYLGIGTGHREATAERIRPVASLVAYLDILDAEGVPVDRRLIAALGPKVLDLARERSLGSIPYLTVPAHTRQARAVLGPDAVLAIEQKVVLDDDVERGRAIGRAALENSYLKMENYVSTLHRSGFTDADTADGGTDALIDALVAHGSADDIVAEVSEHRAAGADHLAVQVLPPAGDVLATLETIAGSFADRGAGRP